MDWLMMLVCRRVNLNVLEDVEGVCIGCGGFVLIGYEG